jgi:predicted transposase/invertase (TIGR01784 family)
MYDNICKFLAETFPADFATWLLGQPIPLTQLSPSELSLEPIRADSLILLDSDELVLHLEFQTDPDPTMGFRMLDYRIRLYRRFPHKQIRQIVIYLRPSSSELVYQNIFTLPNTRHEYEVIRLWEQPTAAFLSSPGLLAFATLSATADQTQTLRSVTAEIERIPEVAVQRNIASAASILAGLVLNPAAIRQILRRDVMRESAVYQEILAEGRAEGEARGRVEGRTEGERLLVLQLLNRQVGTLDAADEAQVMTLSVSQIEALAEALLRFTTVADLQAWLRANTTP